MASGGKRSAPPKPFDSKSAASSGGEAWKKISGPQMLAINSEHKIRSENLPFDIDVWYPSLEKFTFPTVFLPLKRTEAQAVLNYQNTRFNSRPRLTTTDVASLRGLESRIDKFLATYFPGRPAFMRLCGRSMKDADPMNRTGVWERYQRELKAIISADRSSNQNAADTKSSPADDKSDAGTGTDSADVGLKLRAISRVSYLHLTTGAEAMSLLLTSERAFTDLHDWLQYGEPDQLVFREFEPELQIENEFRAFVWKGKLTAISQYDHYAVYPQLLQKSFTQNVSDKIKQFWTGMHPSVGVDTYVADFGYFPSTDSIRLIELSPFRTCTGSAMFRWSNPTDVEILHGQREFEFRVNEHVNPSVAQLVESNWELRWNSPPTQQQNFRYDHWYDQTIESGAGTASNSAASTNCAAAATAKRKGGCPWRRVVLITAVLALIVAVIYSNPVYRRRMTRFMNRIPQWATAAATILTAFVCGAYGSWTVMSRSEAASNKPVAVVPDSSDPAVTTTATSATTGRDTYMFFYGTLKTGFHWNTKFLSHAERVGDRAITCERWPLVVGDSGVPYLLGDVKCGSDEKSGAAAGEFVHGEVWRCDPVTLQNLDEYEGISKGYYERRTIRVRVFKGKPTALDRTETEMNADVYVLNRSADKLRNSAVMSEYSLEFHRQHYKPIQHILVKQDLYLSEQLPNAKS